MNVVCLLLDSLNRHFLPAYGNTWMQTPNLDRLAERACVFDNNYVGSLPCMPARRDLWTGRIEFLHRPWGSLEPWDAPLPRVLRQGQALTELITDHYHLFERGGENYHIDFEGWEFIRGHENDPWETAPAPLPPHIATLMPRYWRNVTHHFHEERDFMAPRTLQAVADWLGRNHQQNPFFLLVDEFDPHEPFHVPPPYDTMYEDVPYDGPLFIWPSYGRNPEYNEEQIRHIRAQYAGKVTMCDTWLGKVLDRFDEHNLWENTALIVMTDHGHFLGDHGWWGKPGCPQYNTIAHTPMMISMPGSPSNGSRSSALTTTVDLYPTILEMMGQPAPVPDGPGMGRSLLPLLTGAAQSVRDCALYGWFADRVNYTDGRYTYLRGAVRPDRGPVAMYSQRWSTAPWWQLPPPAAERMTFGQYLPYTDMAVGRMELSVDEFTRTANQSPEVGVHYLFDIENDPQQEHNLAGTLLEAEMAERLAAAMRASHAPAEQFIRLGL
ncbi:MAG: sulfatase [Armatimonadota bacterium]